MDNVKLFSNKVWIAEEQNDPDALLAKVIICDFSVNKNGVMLNRDTITDWMASLVTSPLVGKIKAKSNGEIDFTSHNATVVTRVDENGKEYTDVELNTDAFGTFTDIKIETIDGVECIVASARCWKRFYDACNLIVKRIKDGTLSTSWEISVENAEQKILNGALVKVINKGRFIGHALLSSQTTPAYDISRVLEVAAKEENDDDELCSALIRDVMKLNNDGNEVEKMDEERIVDELDTGGVENAEKEKVAAPASHEEAGAAEDQEKEVTEPAAEPEVPAVSELTMRDLRWKIEESLYKFANRYLDVCFIFPESHTGWAHDWDENETDMHEFTYSVENDEVVISNVVPVTLVVSPRQINASLDEKNSALIESQKQINILENQIAELTPFKEAAEQAARDRAEAEKQEQISELRKYAEDSGVVTNEELDGGEVHEMIAALNATELKVLIADRIVQKQKKVKPATETASAKKQAKPRLMLDEAEVTEKPGNVLLSWLHK